MLGAHATAPLARTAKSAIMKSIVRQRRRAGMQKRSRQAIIAAGTERRPSGRAGYAEVALLSDVVETVSVATAASAPEIATGLVAPKLNVGVF
jgi:hypothetical protein